MNISDLQIAKDMKYTALYWALGFEETEQGIFEKKIHGVSLKIDSEKGEVFFGKALTLIGQDYLPLNSHKSFVILECVNQLLTLGYSPWQIRLDLSNQYDIYCANIYLSCFAWEDEGFSQKPICPKQGTFYSCFYRSRLQSGLIERESKISNGDGLLYSQGIFEGKTEPIILSNPTQETMVSSEFSFEDHTATHYLGNQETVVVPEGTQSLASSLFWDNQTIRRVILPRSLISLGGDTFYQCTNLEEVTIPAGVKTMGDNPFAGCPKLHLKNESSAFHWQGDALFSQDGRLIYYRIDSLKESFEIPWGTRIIGKHSFYCCNQLKKLTIPSTVRHFGNNPFSGCQHLSLDCQTDSYHIEDGIIYSRYWNEVVGVLESTQKERLVLREGVVAINRNSFYGCQGIKALVLPKSLERIGYNPFVGCGNLLLENQSPFFTVENGILFSHDKRKLIFCPPCQAVGFFQMPESVTTLERGAFSGCKEMTGINLKNVSIIGKTCFTNCSSLTEVTLPDWVSFVGEWAFAHCQNLIEVSVFKDTFLDKNVFLNSPVTLQIRKQRSSAVIESENLYTLESLTRTLSGKIDSILIDPPYNSNISYIGYQDSSFSQGYGNFMRQRILLAKDLLSPKGWLVISIDSGERKELTQICRSIFGWRNVSLRLWKKKNKYFDKNRIILNPKKKQRKYEYLIFCRKTNGAKLGLLKQPYVRHNELKEKIAKVPLIFDNFGTTSSAKDEIKAIFGKRDAFSTPKPLKLVKEILRATSAEDSIVLDFFAGSGTTGDACNQLNQEDQGKRRYLLVSNSESDICNKITRKRLNKDGHMDF